MHETHQREQAIFDAALELPPEQRAGHLDRACGDDAALRQRVEALLKACEGTCEFLDARVVPPAGSVELSSASFEKPGDWIGRYKLLQQIGEGGCGVVYMAEQEEPVRRRVALKVIKLGMDTKSVIARFEAERQALAMMDHPNIAKVLDAGATETGRPYFVMELVRGIRITDYCDHLKLSTRDRLALFISVCQAIQHAHQKGIIHRDLKPSNVLVTEHDGVAVPKIIDFGIAKATTDQRLTDKTLFTAFEQFIGTPAYTSPEQAGLGGLDIDTRSDIYSLGVLLYELLTGHPPFSPAEFQRSAIDEILRVIREQEPARPSARVTTLSERELTTIAQLRRIESAKMSAILRGDLDWIVMKCLEKDRARRYETANGLATDIQRHLSQEPVLACPPSNLYRFRKLVRRNKLTVLATTAVVAALISGLSISTWMFIREREATKRAVAGEKKAQTEAKRAEQNEQQARESEADAKAVLDFLRNKVLAAARPEGVAGGIGREVTLRRAVEVAEPQIALTFTNRPVVEIQIRNALGKTFHDLGAYSNAMEQFEKAFRLSKIRLGPEHRETLKAMGGLAAADYKAGKWSEMMPLLEESVRLHRKALGSDHTETMKAMGFLAAIYVETGRLREGLLLTEETVKTLKTKRGVDDSMTLDSMLDLARAYQRAERLAEAISLYEEVLRLGRGKFGSHHPFTSGTMFNLATAYLEARRMTEAVSLNEEAVKLMKSKLGPSHLGTLSAIAQLGFAYQQSGRLPEALPLYQEALKGLSAAMGPAHGETLRALKLLAGAYVEAKRLDDAEQLLLEWLTILERQNQRNTPFFRTYALLGAVYFRQKRYAEAEQVLLKAYQGLKKRDDENPTPWHASPIQHTVEEIVQLYKAWGKPDLAGEWREKLVSTQPSSRAPKDGR